MAVPFSSSPILSVVNFLTVPVSALVNKTVKISALSLGFLSAACIKFFKSSSDRGLTLKSINGDLSLSILG